MSKFVGRKGKLALAIESTRGAAPADNSFFFVPVATMSFKDTVEEVREDQGMGVIADSDSKFVTMRMGEGEVESQLYSEALGVVLTGVLGAVPSSSGGGSPYTHTYTLSNSNQHKSVSLYWSDPDRSDMYKLGMIDSFQMSVEPSGIVNYTVGFKSKVASEWTSITSDYTGLGTKFLHQHTTIKLASDTSGLSAATALSVKKLELNTNKNTMYDSVIGTVEPEDILNQQLSVEGSMDLNLEDDTFRDYMLNGTYRAMEIKLNASANAILTLQFPRVDFSQWESDYSLNEIAKQTINFKANYDAANAVDIISTATLVNTTASY